MLYDSEYDKEAPVVLDARRLTSLELNKLLQSNDEMSLEYEVHLVSIMEDRVGSANGNNDKVVANNTKNNNLLQKQPANPYKIPKFKAPTHYIPPPLPPTSENQLNKMNSTTITSNNVPKNGGKYMIQSNEIDAAWDDDEDDDANRNNNNNVTEVVVHNVEYSCYSTKVDAANQVESPSNEAENVVTHSPTHPLTHSLTHSLTQDITNGADVLPYDANFWDD
jgi:hypothetical protein